MNVRINPVTSANNKIGFGMAMEFYNPIDPINMTEREKQVVEGLKVNDNFQLTTCNYKEIPSYTGFFDINGGKVGNPLDERGTTLAERIIANTCKVLGIKVHPSIGGEQMANAIKAISKIK